MDEKVKPDLLGHMARIVAGYAAHHKVDDLPALMRQVYDALVHIEDGKTSTAQDNDLQPAVPISKSVTPDYLVCLEDGKKMKMLKRYLKTTYKMTPDEYRAKWKLPDDYPMVAPNYAQKRSRLAKAIGLGTDGNRGRK
jgi:predicted transcriptional regulator